MSGTDAIRVFAPCRIDLAGGTLDIHPLYLMIPNACTVNLAISTGVEVEVETLEGSNTRVEVVDRGMNFQIRPSGPSAVPEGAELVDSVIRHFIELGFGPFRVRTRSTSPPGAGLGASSSLCVALVTALSELSGLQLRREQLVSLCLDLEARVLGTPAGYQDYIAAIGGGLQEIRFPPGGVRPGRLAADTEELARRCMLVYTGMPHHSGLNNWQIFKAFVDGSKTVRSSLMEIGSVAESMAGALRKGNWHETIKLMEQEWELRKKLSSVVTTGSIDNLVAAARRHGGAGKACGAGGGGCVLLWHDGRQSAIEELHETAVRQKGQILEWHVHNEGCAPL